MSREIDRDMSFQDRSLTSLLDEYAEDLRAGRASAALDRRMEESITAWAEEHRSRDVLRRPWLWIAAAASIVVITGGVALLALGQRGGDADGSSPLVAHQFPVVPEIAAVSTLANGGQVSLYPAEGAVFRVKANLTSATMRTGQKVNDEEGDRQYWVDVRISNDGTMRIMQVLPAERGRVVPYE